MSLAQVLPLALFLLMAQLVIGSFLVLLLADYEGEVGGAFLGRSALWFFAGALLAAWIRGRYPAAEVLLRLNVRPDWLGREGWAFTGFLILLGLYNPAVWIGWRPGRRVVGGLAAVAGGRRSSSGRWPTGRRPGAASGRSSTSSPPAWPWGRR